MLSNRGILEPDLLPATWNCNAAAAVVGKPRPRSLHVALPPS